MKTKPKIAVAMSGGVDSSVAALLLKKQGFDCVGVNLNLWSCFKGSKAKTCCSPEDRRDASNVCEKLGMPFISIDMRDEFKEKIIRHFVEEYSKGRTPNPCIRCNTLIKFDSMLKWVGCELGIERIATGHYVRVASDASGTHLFKGRDANKDQSYFLYDISPEILSKLHFPVGEYLKDDVRKFAAEEGLPVAEKEDSQEVCFIPDNDVASFIEDFYPELARPVGEFVDSNGNKLGHHRGTHAYTIGQRRGLGIGFGERRYVTEIRPESREVVLGGDEDLFKKEFDVENVSLIEKIGNAFSADIKIRYKGEATPGKVTITEGKKAHVTLERPVRAVTPGQAAVFYDGDIVIGGGWITTVIPAKAGIQS